LKESSFTALTTFGASTALISWLLLFSGVSVADPWTTFPGTKARGMGTAFVAIANDPSAAWHNPAGLYQMKGMNISLEGGNAPKYNLDDGRGMVFNKLLHPQTGENIDFFYGSSWTETVTGNESYFLSWNMGNGKTYGLGLYYYQPYNIETTQLRGTVKYLSGYIVEDVAIYGSGYSGDLYLNKDSKWFSSLHYGFTVEYIDVTTDGTELLFDLDGTNTDTKPVPIDSIDVQEGWTGSFGFLATIYNGHLGDRWSPTVKVGGVYRMDAYSSAKSQDISYYDEQVGNITLKTQDYFNAKPASWDFGVSANMKISSGPSFGLLSLEVATQIGETEFDSVLTDMNYRKQALGMALRLTRPRGHFVRQIELRLGYYQEQSDSPKNKVLIHNNNLRADESGNDNFRDGLIYPDVSGFTWGVQLAFDGGYLLEFANEHRNLENALFCNVTDSVTDRCERSLTNRKFSETYWTVALRYNW
jgi:hypothetical protein